MPPARNSSNLLTVVFLLDAQEPRQGPHRGGLEDRHRGEVDAEPALDLLDDLQTLSDVPPRSKKLSSIPRLLDPEHLLPDVGEGALQSSGGAGRGACRTPIVKDEKGLPLALRTLFTASPPRTAKRL